MCAMAWRWGICTRPNKKGGGGQRWRDLGRRCAAVVEGSAACWIWACRSAKGAARLGGSMAWADGDARQAWKRHTARRGSRGLVCCPAAADGGGRKEVRLCELRLGRDWLGLGFGGDLGGLGWDLDQVVRIWIMGFRLSGSGYANGLRVRIQIDNWVLGYWAKWIGLGIQTGRWVIKKMGKESK